MQHCSTVCSTRRKGQNASKVNGTFLSWTYFSLSNAWSVQVPINLRPSLFSPYSYHGKDRTTSRFVWTSNTCIYWLHDAVHISLQCNRLDRIRSVLHVKTSQFSHSGHTHTYGHAHGHTHKHTCPRTLKAISYMSAVAPLCYFWVHLWQACLTEWDTDMTYDTDSHYSKDEGASTVLPAENINQQKENK